MSLMREMEYRVDLAIFSLQTLVFIFFNLLFYKVIISSIGSIGTWDYPDMVVLFGTYAIFDGIFMSFILYGVNSIESLVRTGRLDSILIRPLDSQFLVTVYRGVNFSQVPSIFFGIAVLYYGILLENGVNLLYLPYYLLFLLLSSIIIYSMTLIISCAIFFIADRSGELNEIIFSLKTFAKFPDIYKGKVRFAFLMFVPVAFASYVPSGVLLGKVGVPFLIYYFVVSAVFLVGSRFIWKKGLIKYKSAGG